MSAEQSQDKSQPLPDAEPLVAQQEDLLERWAKLPPAQQAVLVLDILERTLDGPYDELLTEALETRMSSQVERLGDRKETRKRFRSFLVTSLCRADMEERFTREEIDLFDDADMRRLAEKMGDWYMDAGYWDDMETIGRAILDEKKGQDNSDGMGEGTSS